MMLPLSRNGVGVERNRDESEDRKAKERKKVEYRVTYEHRDHPW